MSNNIPPAIPMQHAPFHEADAVACAAVINDEVYAISRFDVLTNCHGATDTANFTMPISTNNDFTVLFSPANTSIVTDKPVFVKIYAGYPNAGTSNYAKPSLNGLLTRFYGILDQYTANFNDDTVTFECRSLAAPLTTQKVQAPFSGPSVTTIQWIQQIATINGLNTNIFSGINPLTMQQVLGNELQAGVHVYPIWDLMLQCAVQDDVDIWVDATGTLWYYPSDKIPRFPVNIHWGGEITELSVTHGIQFMKNVEVRVHSYIPHTKFAHSARTFTLDGQTITTQGATREVTSSPVFGTTESVSTSTNAAGVTTTTQSNSSGGATLGSLGTPANYSGKQLYERWIKNATQQQCEKIAQQYYRQIILHEYQVSMRVPVTRANFSTQTKSGIVSKMGIQALINLTGAPYAAINKPLWPRQIKETFEPSDGWYWKIESNVNTPAQGGV
jgi:hypothetical protein